MTASSPLVVGLVRGLLLLGVGAQLWLTYEMRYDLPVLLCGDATSVLVEVLVNFAPIFLAIVGAAIATWLGRRGSRWAVPVAVIPVAILLFGLGLALILTAYPIACISVEQRPLFDVP